MATSDHGQVAAVTREFLETSNLDEISEKRLRQLVQERTGADTSLPDLKALIHSVVEEFVTDSKELQEGAVKEEEGGEGRRGGEGEGERGGGGGGGGGKKRKGEDAEDAGAASEEDGHRPAKKGGDGGATKKFEEGGEPGELIICRLSSKRRVTVKEYRGTIFVHIREYYEKNGQELPGKGISLPVDQWNTLSSHVEDITEAIRQVQQR